MVQRYSPIELATEEWRDVVDYEGIYQVSTLGRLRRWRKQTMRWFMLSIMPDKTSGYVRVNLSRNGKVKTVEVHRLVARAFIGDRPKGYHTNHKLQGKENRSNNRLSNLEYIPSRDNTAPYAEKLDQHWARRRPELIKRGEDAPGAKLKAREVALIKYLSLAGLRPFEIAPMFLRHWKTISDICKGITWRHVEPMELR